MNDGSSGNSQELHVRLSPPSVRRNHTHSTPGCASEREAMDEEVEEEVAALESVYADACVVVRRCPPLVEVALLPHTGGDATVQYVQATLVIAAGPEYPREPPQMELREAKGLDDHRHTLLLGRLREHARMGCPGPLLVALCEEAKELLTSMNQPDGDCCFCMAPIVSPPGHAEQPLHFMKLMSCFHCFHSECFGKWWRWESGRLEEQHKEAAQQQLPQRGGDHRRRLCVRCPICRTPVADEDVAHVSDSIKGTGPLTAAVDTEEDGPGTVGVPQELWTDAERERQRRFAALYGAQHDRGGIIEAKRSDVLVPGVIVTLPSPPHLPAKSSAPPGPADATGTGAPQADCPGKLALRLSAPGPLAPPSSAGHCGPTASPLAASASTAGPPAATSDKLVVGRQLAASQRLQQQQQACSHGASASTEGVLLPELPSSVQHSFREGGPEELPSEPVLLASGDGETTDPGGSAGRARGAEHGSRTVPGGRDRLHTQQARGSSAKAEVGWKRGARRKII